MSDEPCGRIIYCQRNELRSELEQAKARIEELERYADSAEAEAKELREALEEIARPIKFMQERAKKEGAVLNGGMAIMLADDPNHLKGIALAALAPAEKE